MDIYTSRLKLLSCSASILETVLSGDAAVRTLLGLNVPEKWSEFGEVIFRWSMEKLKENPSQQKWHSYLPILHAENTLIGTCGYKGAPVNGIVEIGYEIAAAYRGKGYAKELANALIAHAFADVEVEKVIAHTLAEENASGSILRHCGMKKVDEYEDPEDGKVWRWEISAKKNET